MAATAQERSFDEWMKIAADNKINASNTWNLALIDYFHDMSLVKDGNEVNFQKASCTLDGCVKIYTSRVDSVDAETKNLLNGLSDTSNNAAGEDENDDPTNAEEGKRKRAIRSGNTLEKDFSNLNVKKLETEYMIDPLFKKTSADFDEGSASGLLLNHLNMAPDGMIIFDASDDATAGKQIGDADQEEEDGNKTSMTAESHLVDISKLKAKCFHGINDIWQYEICPSLQKFQFQADGSVDVFSLSLDSLLDNDTTMTNSHSNADEAFQFQDNDDSVSDFDDVGGDDGFGDGFGDDFNNQHEGLSSMDSSRNEGEERNPNQMHHSATSKEIIEYVSADIANDDETAFSYFNSNMMKRWAGPEHWKPSYLKKSVPPADTPQKKVRKEKIVINFYDASPDEKTLFSTSSVSINMPKYSDKLKFKNVLPNDEHFAALDFFKLFLKPHSQGRFYKRNGSRTSVTEPEEVEQIDQEFLSQHQNDFVTFNAPESNEFVVSHEDLDDDDDDDHMPFIDDSPDNDASMGDDSFNFHTPDSVLEYGDQLVAQPKKVKANFLHFAKAPKKVDIKKLKTNLWQTLEDVVEVPGPKKFSDVLQQLPNHYPERKLGDISVAFCFICLLHLANEKNLKVDITNQDLSITHC